MRKWQNTIKVVAIIDEGKGNYIQTQTLNRMNVYLDKGKYKLIAFLCIMLFAGITSLKAQDTINVNGYVVNGANRPVADVSIEIEGSYELPSISDEEGHFSFKTTDGNVWLNIVPVGDYKKKRLFLGNREQLTIFLTEEDVPSGHDPVKILSQDIPKRNVLSSIEILPTENVRHLPALSVDQIFQGRVSGAHVVNRSGAFGSGAVTMIRGVNSLNANTEPLYVIDGIPISFMGVFNSNIAGFSYNPLLGLNPLDISNVAIIKDQTATAAYGSKASNGLILIETLDPSATQTVIDLDLRTGYSLSPSQNINQLDGVEHKTLINQLLFSSGMQEELIQEKYPNLFLSPEDERYIDYKHNTNWQNLIFSDAAFTNLNISVKGGDEAAKYGLSFGYQNGDGIVKATGYEGYNIRFVSLVNIFTWLKFNANVSLSYNLSQLKESGKADKTSPILSSLGKSPLLNPYRYNDEGQEMVALADVDELGVSNPQAIIDNYEASNNNFNFITGIGLEATLKKNLFINSNFGLTYNLLKERVFMPNQGMELYYNDEAINVSKAANNNFSSIYNNTYLRFNKSFGNDHHFTSNTGIHVLTNKFEYDWGLTKNAHENDQYRMLQDGTRSLREFGGKNSDWNWMSLYESVTYNYRDKYLASAVLTVDGSSRIGDQASGTLKVMDIPFGLFYSVGLGWRLSNEPILIDKSWIEELKLRLSYGRSGNDDIGESNASRYYNAVRFRESSGLVLGTVPNEKLTYETVTQLNGGLDFSLWGSRLSTSIDLYTSVIDNMLIYSPLKPYFGYDFRPENGGAMQNKGVDLSFYLRIIEKNSFKWDFQLSYSRFNNEISEITGDKQVTKIKGAEIVNMVGEKANSFYGYFFEGVYKSTAEAEAASLVNDKLVAYGAGDAIFSDLSGPDGLPDGIINDYDKTVIGSSIPDFFGGVNNTFKYKRWSLNTFVQAVVGNEIFNYIRYRNESMTGLENQSKRVLNRWNYQGQDTDVPRALYNDPIGNSSFSTRWLEDGSYLRIKNISLSYTIPNEFFAFRNAQFYVSASNVFTFSKYLGYDPEFAHSRNQIEQGIDYGQVPQPRQFMIGVKLGL